MRFGLSVLMVSVLSIPSFAHSQQAIMGNWSRQDGSVRAKVADCGKSICFINTWVRDPDGDEKVGDRVVMDVKPQGENKLAGSGFEPRRKLNLSIELALAGDTLNTRGCVVGGLICRSVVWNRAR